VVQFTSGRHFLREEGEGSASPEGKAKKLDRNKSELTDPGGEKVHCSNVGRARSFAVSEKEDSSSSEREKREKERMLYLRKIKKVISRAIRRPESSLSAKTFEKSRKEQTGSGEGGKAAFRKVRPRFGATEGEGGGRVLSLCQAGGEVINPDLRKKR